MGVALPTILHHLVEVIGAEKDHGSVFVVNDG